jgi:hypothetical protein
MALLDLLILPLLKEPHDSSPVQEKPRVFAESPNLEIRSEIPVSPNLESRPMFSVPPALDMHTGFADSPTLEIRPSLENAQLSPMLPPAIQPLHNLEMSTDDVEPTSEDFRCISPLSEPSEMSEDFDLPVEEAIVSAPSLKKSKSHVVELNNAKEELAVKALRLLSRLCKYEEVQEVLVSENFLSLCTGLINEKIPDVSEAIIITLAECIRFGIF